MSKKDSIMPLYGLFPLREWTVGFLYPLKNYDNTGVNIAILGHYGE